jgi:hypothetical protein
MFASFSRQILSAMKLAAGAFVFTLILGASCSDFPLDGLDEQDISFYGWSSES